MTDFGSACDFCGQVVTEAAFAQGRAVKVLAKTYCENCMTTAIQRSRNPAIKPDFITPRPGRIDPMPGPGSKA